MAYPIVLAHGVARFDVVTDQHLHLDNNDDPKLDRLHYFKGVRTMLKGLGYDVFHTDVSWAGDVDRRAADLKKGVEKILADTGKENANIVAHSMGGLDTRHMLFNDRNEGKIHERIASISTISAPHHGSPFADWGLEHLSEIPPLLDQAGIDVDAFQDLTTESTERFNGNPEVTNFEIEYRKDIQIRTFAGRQKSRAVFRLLKLPFRLIQEKEGENDGLVSLRSARWMQDIPVQVIEHADHLNELGWWDFHQLLVPETPGQLLRRIHKFYADLAAQLP
jgi:triacylglycerol lipase